MEPLSEENLDQWTTDSGSSLSLTTAPAPVNATSSKWISKLLGKTKKSKRENAKQEQTTKDLTHKSKIPVLKSKNTNSSLKNLFFHKIINSQDDSNLKISYSLGKITTHKSSLRKLSESCTKIELESSENSVQNVDDFGLKSFYQISKLTQFIPKKFSLSGLRDLGQISDQIRDSEAYVIQVMAKYVKKPNLVQSLLDCFSKHANLSMDADQRVQKLTQEVWLQQSEVMKHREFTLQSNLGCLTKLNRRLQAENEVLAQKNENLGITTISQFPNSDLGNQLMETLSKNNEKLRQKTKTLLMEIEEQDKRLQSLLEDNQSMEHQLLNVNSQLFKFKNLVQRIQHQNDLDSSILSHQLQTKQDILNECVKNGDILWKNMEEEIKKNCKLNWPNLKDRERSLPDLINFCQISINDLAIQLASVKNEIESVRSTNSELSDKMKIAEANLSKSELERSFCLANMKTSNDSFEFYVTKCTNYKDELEEIKEQLRKSNEELESAKLRHEKLIAEMEASRNKAVEKDEEAIFNKEKISEYKCQNDSLRMQLHGLKQVFETAGSGDVARELADTHEKMTCFQSQYYQMLSEKNFLVEQLQTANVDRETFNQYQNMYHQFIQAQQKELESSNDEIINLKHELENKTRENLTLQSQQTKLLDEKDIMKKIYQQLKCEISRVQQLEGTVAGINLEASKLAIIAEFNKQLGEKLQCEVCEKDEKITELECSVLELNNAQMENTKDKVALCVELNEVFNMNSQLSDSLLVEQEKIANLDEFKRSLEKSVSTQMQAVEEMQKSERAALKELLKDYQCVVTQRDNYHTKVDEYEKELTDLKAKFAFQNKKLENTNKKYLEHQEMVERLSQHVQDFEKELKIAKEEKIKLENLSSVLNKELDEKTLKNQKLESSQSYLQTNAQKLHYELNDARKLKVELDNQLAKELEQNDQLEIIHNEIKAAFEKASSENKELAQKVLALQEAYNNLEDEYQREANTSVEAGEKVKTLMDEMEILRKNFEEAEKLHQEIVVQKDLELFDSEDFCRNLELELEQVEFTADDIEIQSKLLSESSAEQSRLKEMVSELQRKLGEYEEVIESLNLDKRQLEEELNAYAERADNECACCAREMENLVIKYGEQKQEMKLAIESLSENFDEIEKRYTGEREEHLKLIEAHKDLATKLLKAIRLLIEEKLHCQQLEAEMEKCSKQSLVLASEKNSAERMVVVLSGELDEIKQRLEETSCDKQNLQKVLLDLQDMYRRTQSMKKRSANSCPHSSTCSSKASTTGEAENVEDRTKQLKDELKETHKTIIALKTEISSLNQQLTVLEFQKCEVSLRLHENLQKLKNEESLKARLIKTHQDLLSTILKLNQESAISRTACEMLLTLIQGDSLK